ncbi:MAG: anti-sigma factor family protein [Bacillota bacterium]
MGCKENEILLSLYIDEEINENDKKALEEHLQHCEVCKKKLEQLLMIRGVVKQEYHAVKPEAKLKKGVYNKLYIYFLLLFAGLVICFSVFAVTGGLAQLFIISGVPVILKWFFMVGIGLVLVGTVILMYDIYVNVLRIMKKK